MDISLNIRKRSFSGQYHVNKCVICQENKTDALEHKKQRGIQTLKERASQRQKIRDVQYYEAIDQCIDYNRLVLQIFYSSIWTSTEPSNPNM
jgi:hypothetical protein